MVHRKFRVVKPIELKDGTIPVGSTVTIINEAIYFNDGMLHTAFYELFHDLIENEVQNGFKYLREIPIPYNKL